MPEGKPASPSDTDAGVPSRVVTRTGSFEPLAEDLALDPKQKDSALGDERTNWGLNSIDSEARRIWISKILGRQIGPFKVEHAIGEDETGAIFRAYDIEKKRPVRLKVLWLKIAWDEKAFARFVRAMRTLIDLKHPNLVQLYAAGKDGEYCFMAQEYVDAVPVTQVIRQQGNNGKLEWKQALKVVLDVCSALELAFENSILHRDIKPNHILMAKDGSAKLDNLILAKATEGAQAEQISVKGAGEIIGDLAYMAPELLHGEDEADWRSDIYSLGVTFYSLLTGRPPFVSSSVVVLGKMIREDDADPPSKYQPTIPPRLDQIVLRMLAKNPDDRYATPSHVLRDLRTVTEETA